MRAILPRTTASNTMAIWIITLSLALCARTIHVAKTGNDGNAGDSLTPYLTVNKAAQVAQPGDVVAIHAGTYREYVNPARGGTSESARIVYRAGAGEKPVITGAEPVTGWVDQGNNVWLATLPASFFGAATNPYSAYMTHDQYMSYGLKMHPGEVYLNDSALAEDTLQAQVSTKPFSWFCQMSGANTQIYANFAGANPNTQNAEINVREMVFYPTTAGCSYITVNGLQLEKGAHNWIPCCSGEQHAIIGVNGGNFWTIENCTIRYARSVGISILGSGSNMATTGHFIIRNNIIQRCGQAGICGRSGHSNSQIYGNLIEDTNHKNEFGGAETAGIKFHHSIDIIIRNNCIRRVLIKGNNQGGYGIWLDWGGCNVRISSNVIYGTTAVPIYFEVCHGPILVDNNVIAWSPGLFAMQDDGIFLVHNLFYNCMIHPEWGDTRVTTYYNPHSWTSKGSIAVSGSDHKYFNNIMIGGGYNWTAVRSGQASDYNAFLNYATRPALLDTHSVRSLLNTSFKIIPTATSVSISFNLLDSVFKQVQCPMLTSSYIGKASLPDMFAENPDGTPITFNKDFYGNARNATHPTVGPFEDLKSGPSTYNLFSLQGAIGPVGAHNAAPKIKPPIGLRHIEGARFSVMGVQDGSIVIADAMGNVVRWNGLRATGEQRIVCNGLPAGVYFVKLIAGGRTIDAMRFVKS
jgi:alpha-N-arabinofuranosidase